MSTWWYMECGSHDPPLRSDNEISQHTDEMLDVVRGLWADRESLAASTDLWQLTRDLFPTSSALSVRDVSNRDYFGPHAVQFIIRHPKCRVHLVNEYGDIQPVSDD